MKDGEAVGFGSVSFERTFWQAGKTEAEIDEMVVDKAHRQRGIVALLLARLMAVAARAPARVAVWAMRIEGVVRLLPA